MMCQKIWLKPCGVQVSVGRLGIITQVKLPIKAQKAVKRIVAITTMDGFVQELLQIEQKYASALQTGDAGAIAEALDPVEALQVSRSLHRSNSSSAWKASKPVHHAVLAVKHLIHHPT